MSSAFCSCPHHFFVTGKYVLNLKMKGSIRDSAAVVVSSALWIYLTSRLTCFLVKGKKHARLVEGGIRYMISIECTRTQEVVLSRHIEWHSMFLRRVSMTKWRGLLVAHSDKEGVTTGAPRD